MPVVNVPTTFMYTLGAIKDMDAKMLKMGKQVKEVQESAASYVQEVDAALKSGAAAEELEHANVTAARTVAEESKAALYDELVAEFQQATAVVAQERYPVLGSAREPGEARGLEPEA